MTYLYEEISAPTRLYIKQCSHCGLKYFGKTKYKNIEKYQGSGKYWKRHLNKHSAHAIHLWNSDWYYDTSIVRFATKFSNINRIVESNDWANQAIENGIQGGYLGKKIWDKSIKKQKVTKSSLAWKLTNGLEMKNKISEKMNSPKWLATTGKIKSNKLKSTYSDDKWIEENYIFCNHCDTLQHPGNYKRWHGDNCKMNPKFEQHKNMKICEHCNKGPMIIVNYKRWHGDNCRTKEL